MLRQSLQKVYLHLIEAEEIADIDMLPGDFAILLLQHFHSQTILALQVVPVIVFQILTIKQIKIADAQILALQLILLKGFLDLAVDIVLGGTAARKLAYERGHGLHKACFMRQRAEIFQLLVRGHTGKLLVFHHIVDNILHNQLLTATAQFLVIGTAVEVHQLAGQGIHAHGFYISVLAAHIVRQHAVGQHQHAFAQRLPRKLLCQLRAQAAAERYINQLCHNNLLLFILQCNIAQIFIMLIIPYATAKYCLFEERIFRERKKAATQCDSLLKIQYYASYSANFAAAFGQPFAAASSK